MYTGTYILTIKQSGGTITERWDVEGFNSWIAAHGEKIGGNFAKRLAQFRRYTNTNVVDWDWVD